MGPRGDFILTACVYDTNVCVYDTNVGCIIDRDETWGKHNEKKNDVFFSVTNIGKNSLDFRNFESGFCPNSADILFPIFVMSMSGGATQWFWTRRGISSEKRAKPRSLMRVFVIFLHIFVFLALNEANDGHFRID